MKSGSTIIALLSKWITGNEAFLELYDKKAMHKDSERNRHGKSALGMNTDENHFVAERTASYDVHIQE